MIQFKWKRSLVRITLALAVAYFLLLLAVFFAQRRLLYFPSNPSLKLSLIMAQRAGFEPWETGGQIIGWKQISKTNGPRYRVLITHGNAGCALDRVDYSRSLITAENCDTYILEYPGYGHRSGTPTQQSLFHSGDEAMALLEKDGPVYLIGESLGTGLAAYLAGTHPQAVTGILLIAPYHNFGDVAQSHMPFLPARWMVLDKFQSAEHLRNYHGRLAVLLGGRDTVVPGRFGRKLFDAYIGPKKLWESPMASHNDLPNEPDEWWRELFDFWKN